MPAKVNDWSRSVCEVGGWGAGAGEASESGSRSCGERVQTCLRPVGLARVRIKNLIWREWAGGGSTAGLVRGPRGQRGAAGGRGRGEPCAPGARSSCGASRKRLRSGH
ncbi:hypothetical protein AAFF_G00136090 [Aldrovandia affinis]|uniref:Uncharacterized protein n=1 Tax=Aldrovandia affinis TaxID=143900 RepID=A0AAD7RPW0_9TELE|nr:hypothetical protein AAFF_G00136090 [Aldrovandia affinis]